MLLAPLRLFTTFLGALAPTLAVSAPPAVSASGVAPIQWTSCPSGIPSAVQCANYSVPLDYNQPAGRIINLAMVRVRGNSTSSKGSIYINPGGPGGSGVDLALSLLQLPSDSVPYQLLNDYDVVGIDPRGVGQSSPIKCDPGLWNQRVPTRVKDRAAYDTMVQHWTAVGESCKNLTGPLLDHLDTIHVVQDFDRVRQAIGDTRLNFLGLSYGTQIGYTYAEMFPDRVGRMVIDGILDHTKPTVYVVQTESTAYETTLGQFFNWCRQNSSCALHGRGDPQTFFHDLVAKVQAQPLPAPSCQQTGPGACQLTVTYEDFMSYVQQGLTMVNGQPGVRPGWAELAENLLAASQGNATLMSATYYTSEVDTTGNWASLAIGCQDWMHAQSFTDLLEIQHMTSSLSPVTKGFTQGYGYVSRCIGWPARVTNPYSPIQATIGEAPPILMVNAFHDPETSVQWAVSVRQQIPHASLIFRNGSGHTSYGTGGDTAQAMNGFLLHGRLPADGTVYQS